MAEEPEVLGDRLRRIESVVSRLQGDMVHARAAEHFFSVVFEHVLMPSILLLAGHGHREAVANMLERAGIAHGTDPQVDETVRQAGADLLRGWEEWVRSLPEFEPPTFRERHPDLYD